MYKKSPNDPRIKKIETIRFFDKKSYESHSFVINDHFDHKFAYKTYVKSKISKKALDCLNIKSVSLLGL